MTSSSFQPQVGATKPMSFWNLQFPGRYSNLSSLTLKDLEDSVADESIRRNPDRFWKYSNSKGLNVIVNDGKEVFHPILLNPNQVR